MIYTRASLNELSPDNPSNLGTIMSNTGTRAMTAVRQAAARVNVKQQENRLTAVLAVTLAGNEQLTRALMQKCGVRLRGDGVTFDVRPQARIRPGTATRRTTDIAITALRGSRSVGRLWCEAKQYAREGPRQLDDQFAALCAQAPASGNGRLLAIVLRDNDGEKIKAADRESLAFKVCVMTWLDVKDLVNEIGARTLGADWLDLPAQAAEGMDIAVLRAFVRWVEGRDCTSPILTARALSDRSIAAIEAGDKVALRRARWFLWHAATSDRVRTHAEFGSLGYLTHSPDGGLLLRQDLCPGPATRFSATGFYPFIGISVSESSGTAMLQVGAFAQAGNFDWVGRDLDAWASRLANARFDVAGVESLGEEVQIARSKPLREIAACGPSIRAQRTAAVDLISRGLRNLDRTALLIPGRSR
jgi:hypothetical protein